MARGRKENIYSIPLRLCAFALSAGYIGEKAEPGIDRDGVFQPALHAVDCYQANLIGIQPDPCRKLTGGSGLGNVDGAAAWLAGKQLSEYFNIDRHDFS